MPTKSEIIEKLAGELEKEWLLLRKSERSEDFEDYALRTSFAKRLSTACFNAMSEYVTFLEEGSEPQVGDVVKFDKIVETGYGQFTYKDLLHNVSSVEILNTIKDIAINIKVIQNAGKPVITLQKE